MVNRMYGHHVVQPGRGPVIAVPGVAQLHRFCLARGVGLPGQPVVLNVGHGFVDQRNQHELRQYATKCLPTGEGRANQVSKADN